MRYTTFAVFTSAALVLAAGGAEAQAVDRNAEGIPVAIELEKQVESAIADARWSDAASMLRTASDLRPAGDPVALSDLASAGALYGTIGRFDEARRVFVELADRATQHGAFAVAGDAWIDATHAAAALGNARLSVEYFDRARRLATSALLSTQEAQALDDRLSQSSALVARLAR